MMPKQEAVGSYRSSGSYNFFVKINRLILEQKISEKNLLPLPTATAELLLNIRRLRFFRADADAFVADQKNAAGIVGRSVGRKI